MSNFDEMKCKAYKTVVEFHRGQTDLAGVTYTEHLKTVANNVSRVTDDDATIAVAWLHDILEDTKMTEKDLSNIFSSEIVEAVKAITKLDNEDYDNYIKRVKTNRIATIVKIEDLKHNSDLSRLGRSHKSGDIRRLNKYSKALEYLRNDTKEVE